MTATALPSDGLMHVFGVDPFGREFSFAIDALVLARACDDMGAASELTLSWRRHKDGAA